jgi:hypothetical protein
MNGFIIIIIYCHRVFLSGKIKTAKSHHWKELVQQPRRDKNFITELKIKLKKKTEKWIFYI